MSPRHGPSLVAAAGPPAAGLRLAAVGLLAALAACSGDVTWPAVEPLTAPADLGDGWSVAAPQAAGFDAGVLARLDQRLRDREISGVDALLVARGGVLVYEGYYGPYTGVDRRHFLASATKSIAATVGGVAARQGLLDGPEQSIADLFPEATDLFEADPRKRRITLRDVLTMTAGLDWDTKPVTDRDRDDIHISTAPDAVRYVLEKAVVDEPGERFFYSSGCSMLLTGLVPNVSGMEADVFAREHLFDPLGIEDVLWQTTGDGTARGQDGLHMRARDLLKIGQLYLDGGTWEGSRIVDETWIDESIRGWTTTDWGGSGYGYQWWTYPLERPGADPEPDGVAMASGYGGQKLFVIPALDLTAVFFGCTTSEGGAISYECGYSDVEPELAMWGYVLRALGEG